MRSTRKKCGRDESVESNAMFEFESRDSRSSASKVEQKMVSGLSPSAAAVHSEIYYVNFSHTSELRLDHYGPLQVNRHDGAFYSTYHFLASTS